MATDTPRPDPQDTDVTTTRPALEVRDITKAFGDTRALDGMSWDAAPGAVTALLGPNGAGKTTALRCIAGVLRPDAGTIRVVGAPSTSATAREAISFLPEQPDLYPALTVGEHLRFVAIAHRLGGAWRDHADALLERFDLADQVDTLPGALSQGQRRKAALVTALLHGAEVLLFDEPFNGLDPPATRELRDVLVGLAAGGATVVVSTHGLAAAERFLDHAVVVDAGRDRATGSLDELRRAAGVTADADLEDTFLALTGRSLTDDGTGAREHDGLGTAGTDARDDAEPGA